MPKKIPQKLPPMPEPEEQELTEEEAESRLIEEENGDTVAGATPAQARNAPGVKPVPAQPKAPVPRFAVFKQQEAEGIIDSETKEVIATDVWTALAKIMESQERIENNIGSMLGN